MRGRKPNVVACVHCRQMKLACNASQKFPSACSRCDRTGAICSIDPSFKRTTKREQLRTAERELREIKQRLQAPDDQGNFHVSPEASDSQPTADSSTASIRQKSNLTEDQLPITRRSIGNIEVPAQLTRDLLEEYFERYHPYCPILPEDISTFIEYTETSPLLFWTVIVTALRQIVEHRWLYSPIADEVRTIAHDTARPEAGSFHSTQALLLLCYWPLPFQQRVMDPSHTFVALATHNGLRLGLHRPKHEDEFLDVRANHQNMQVLRMRTWVACFIANQSVSAQLGLPPTMQLDHSLLQSLASRPQWLPGTLYYQFQISRQSFNICNMLGHSVSSSVGLLPEPMAVIRNFDAELRALECQHSLQWSKENSIAFLSCRLVLCTFALMAKNKAREEAPSGVESSLHWHVQAYMTASTLIQTASLVPDQLIFAPSRLQKSLINAVFFFVLLSFSRKYQFVDYSVVRNGIQQGQEVLRKFSTITGDNMSRACELINSLSNSSDYPSDHPIGVEELLRVNSRSGANLSLSTILHARERTHRIARNPTLPHSEEQISVTGDLDWLDDFLDFGNLDWIHLAGDA